MAKTPDMITVKVKIDETTEALLAVTRLTLQPGDVLIARPKDEFTQAEANGCRHLLSKVFPDHEVLVVASGTVVLSWGVGVADSAKEPPGEGWLQEERCR